MYTVTIYKIKKLSVCFKLRMAVPIFIQDFSSLNYIHRIGYSIGLIFLALTPGKGEIYSSYIPIYLALFFSYTLNVKMRCLIP